MRNETPEEGISGFETKCAYLAHLAADDIFNNDVHQSYIVDITYHLNMNNPDFINI